MIQSGIYCIENLVNHKKYIGQSNNVYYRWKQHKYELNCGTHDNDYLQKAWNKYGEDNFIFYVIEFCDIDKLNECEIYYIEFYNTFLNKENGYNLTSGGQANKKYSPDVCDKISKSLKGHQVSDSTRRRISENHADISGEKHPMYGKKHSDESKNKMRLAQTGVVSPRRNLNPVYCIELDKVFDDATAASKIFNIDSSGILKCCRKERKTCGGYSWMFVEDIKLEK